MHPLSPPSDAAGKFNKHPTINIQKAENINTALSFLVSDLGMNEGKACVCGSAYSP